MNARIFIKNAMYTHFLKLLFLEHSCVEIKRRKRAAALDIGKLFFYPVQWYAINIFLNI